MLFLKSADNSPAGRPEWCEKSFNILAGKTKPTDDDKDAIGLSLNSNYEKLSEDEKREFRSRSGVFPSYIHHTKYDSQVWLISLVYSSSESSSK